MRCIRRSAAILGIWVSGVAVWIALGPVEDRSAKADVAIVLGAAVNGEEPSPVFAARIDHAITLYNDGRVERIIFTGGFSPEDDLSEGAAAGIYAVEAGVPADAILTEETSRTTYQNLVEARAVMHEVGLDDALIVSDPLHLRRASVMASRLGMDARVSATPTTRYRSWSTQLPFLVREVYFVHHFWILGE